MVVRKKFREIPNWNKFWEYLYNTKQSFREYMLENYDTKLVASWTLEFPSEERYVEFCLKELFNDNKFT